MMKQWKLKEIVLMSIFGVVFAVIYLLFYFFGQGLRNFLTPFGLAPFGYEVIFGIWFIVSIIAAYVIRKPGAAFWSELIAGTVQVLIGSPAGPRLIISAAIQGLGAEVVFAATRYRNFSLYVLVLAGMSAAVFSYAWGWFQSGLAALTPGLIAATFAVRVLSGALLAGLLGKYISDQLAQTGVLRGYALGKELQEKREKEAS
ncbi:ECF transporter S component [Salipaludibacillus sp. CUR1]|uniref:Energy-coupling factor transport system substrate-specific component n=1 Tax=Salipaludibacillus aurantiacus TaxID=1601833 RepID=A0A1H9TU06_9BACI|nr:MULTISPECIES: ECF transporter S component [Salipaludibacillus]MCE7792568.1 ECF transporter S component [Salipaludibacillus sp. CUR1]SES00243.1 energy-coupling factor transport system substrate-specific component [Salipaludibacillus aurantiacus]